MSAKMLRKAGLNAQPSLKRGEFALPKARKPTAKQAKIQELKAKISEMVGYCYRFSRGDIPISQVGYDKIVVAMLGEISPQMYHSTATVFSPVINKMYAYYRSNGADVGNKEGAAGFMAELTDFYNSLPYGEMVGREEFYPLFTLRAMLERLAKAVADAGPIAGFEEAGAEEVARREARKLERGVHAALAVLRIFTGTICTVASELHDEGYRKPIWVPIREPSLVGIMQNRVPEGEAELKAGLDALARFHFKGMGALAQSVGDDSKNYLELEDGRAKSQCREKILATLGELQMAYAAIPFGSLHNDTRYYHLFTANELLKELGRKADAFFSEDSKKQAEQYQRVIVQLSLAFQSAGDIYEQEIAKVCRKIRALPGNETYTIGIHLDG